jgi:hypothetical protein
LIELLVYIGVLFVLMGIGYTALYRCIENSVGLKHNANDITAALRAGELWREDVRTAIGKPRSDDYADGQLLGFDRPNGPVAWLFTTNSVLRFSGAGPWRPVLSNVKSSVMAPDPRGSVAAWRWELELSKRAKSTRVPPLFTFIAVAPANDK